MSRRAGHETTPTVPLLREGRGSLGRMSDVNPNDEIRSKILQYFFDRNAKATSRFGKKGSAVKISDVKRELKALHGLTQPQVMSNLTYLTDRQWVKAVDQQKSVTTSFGTTMPSVVTYYEIAAPGIERIEGTSAYAPRERYPGINIQASGSNVITLGDGNLVNVEHRELFHSLTELKEALAASTLSDGEKLDVSIDIETLKDQLAKPNPDRGVIERLWPRIAKTADLAGLASLAMQLAPAIQTLTG